MLIYCAKGPHTATINFIKHKGPFHIFKEIRDRDKTLQEIEEDQKKFKSSLGQITSRDHEHKDDYQKDVIKNTKNLYNSRHNIINLFNDIAKIRPEAI